MIHKIYSVFDSKSEAHSLPFYQQHEGQALRTFSDWVNDPVTPYSKHPSDYTLFSLGEYDDVTGAFSQDKINSLGNGLQFKTEE